MFTATFRIALFVFLLGWVKGVAQDSQNEDIHDFGVHSHRKKNLERLAISSEVERIRSRFYGGWEVFGNMNSTKVDETYGNLIVPKQGFGFGFGLSAGWIFREAWAFEAGYTRSAVPHQWILDFYNEPYKGNSNKYVNTALFRVKRNLLFGHLDERSSSVWVGIGCYLTPLSPAQLKSDEFIITSKNGQSVDTLLMSYSTTVDRKLVFSAEASIEYRFSMGRYADGAVFIRPRWGGESVITSAFEVNVFRNPEITPAKIVSSSAGVSFGISFSILSGIRYAGSGKDAFFGYR